MERAVGNSNQTELCFLYELVNILLFYTSDCLIKKQQTFRFYELLNRL